MKRRIYIFLCLLIPFNLANSEDGKIGFVDNIDNSKKEITIKIDSGKTVKMGDTIEVITDSGKVLLVVKYPMMTIAICNIKGKGKLSLLEKNMPVYLYGKSQSEDVNATGGLITSDRFNESPNGFLKDNTTGLIWLKDADPSRKSMTWEEAKEFIANLKTGGYNDWRLPTKEEFEYFLQISPNELNSKFNNVRNFYWTSTLFPGSTGLVWVADVDHRATDNNYITNDNYIWAVRDGKGVAIPANKYVKSNNVAQVKDEDPIVPQAMKVCKNNKKEYVSYQRDSSGLVETSFSITCIRDNKRYYYKLDYNNISGSWSEDNSTDNNIASTKSDVPKVSSVKDDNPITTHATELCKKYNKRYVSYKKELDNFSQLVCEVTCRNGSNKSNHKLVYEKFSGEWSDE